MPDLQGNDRHKIRSGLLRMGFGSVGPGLCIAPEHLRQKAARFIDQDGLGEFVEFFVSEHAGPGDLKQKVVQWWELNALEQHYEDFIAATLGYWKHGDRQTLRKVLETPFAHTFRMVTEWRRLPFQDPGLPLDVLPAGWKGEDARGLFIELNSVWHHYRPGTPNVPYTGKSETRSDRHGAVGVAAEESLRSAAQTFMVSS